MQEIGRENAAAIEIWKDAMLRGLGREWSHSEELLATTIATLFNRAARERARGNSKQDVALLREAALLMRDSVFRDPHAAPSPMAAPQ
jgi:hypothetical protein